MDSNNETPPKVIRVEVKPELKDGKNFTNFSLYLSFFILNKFLREGANCTKKQI